MAARRLDFPIHRDPAADHPVPGRDLKDGSADRRLARVRGHTLLSLVARWWGAGAAGRDVAAESQRTDNMRLRLVAVAAEHASLLGRRSDELGPDVAVAVRQHGVPWVHPQREVQIRREDICDVFSA